MIFNIFYHVLPLKKRVNLKKIRVNLKKIRVNIVEIFDIIVFFPPLTK